MRQLTKRLPIGRTMITITLCGILLFSLSSCASILANATPDIDIEAVETQSCGTTQDIGTPSATLTTTGSMQTTESETFYNSKIDDKVIAAMEAMNDTDKLPIYVLLTGLSVDDIDEMFKQKYPDEYNTWVLAERSDDPAYRDQIEFNLDIEEFQLVIEARIQVVHDYFSTRNKALIDQYIAEEDFIFISTIDETCIVRATKETILKLAENSTVVSISLFVDQIAHSC
jgi:hypothetical protein